MQYFLYSKNQPSLSFNPEPRFSLNGCCGCRLEQCGKTPQIRPVRFCWQ